MQSKRIRLISLEYAPTGKSPVLIVSLLNKHYKTSPTFPKEVDLSGSALSGPQVPNVLGKLEDVECLNVSGNKAFDKAGLCTLFRCAPKLQWLNVMNTAIAHQELEGLLKRTPNCSITSIPFHTHSFTKSVNTIIHTILLAAFGIQADLTADRHLSIMRWMAASRLCRYCPPTVSFKTCSILGTARMNPIPDGDLESQVDIPTIPEGFHAPLGSIFLLLNWHLSNQHRGHPLPCRA